MKPLDDVFKNRDNSVYGKTVRVQFSLHRGKHSEQIIIAGHILQLGF
jgi:hypothetical protein